MQRKSPGRRRLTPLWRAIVEIAFIVFLFYSNLLMGEFTAQNGRGKSLIAGFIDILTVTNLTIALVSAVLGYLAFEFLRRKL